MPNKSNYSLIRGRRMRATRLDQCGRPIIGSASTAVTSGFISVAFTAQTTDAEVIEVLNAEGRVCARDPGRPQFNGYGLELTFCGVEPCLYEMLTGQRSVLDYNGVAVGFRMNSQQRVHHINFALELWVGVPGVQCDPTSPSSYGYVLVPFVGAGVVGDFSVENAALNFVITGANTREGNGWGAGPYKVVLDTGGVPAYLPEYLDDDDHLYVSWTGVDPPEPQDGCFALAAPTTIALTGAVAGAPGYFNPKNATPPANLTLLKANAIVGDTGSNKPGAAWTTGQYVNLLDETDAYWSGTAWLAGRK